MLNSINKVIAVAVVSITFVLVGFGSACSTKSTQGKDAQKTEQSESKSNEAKDFPMRFKSEDLDSLPSADKSFMGGGALTPQDEASLLAGVWRMSYQGPACMANAEIVFQPNGGYSGFSQCQNGSYAFHTVGTWRILQSGAVRVQYTNYSPKEFQGNPIRIPDGETMYYRFIDRNRLGFSGGIVAYRVN